MTVQRKHNATEKVGSSSSQDKREEEVTPPISERLSIVHWAEADRPREKMERLGASALSPAELLAILIGSGSVDESAVDLMKRLLNDCNNNLNTLGKQTLQELTHYKGIGPAKAITILAACELGKRRAMEKAEERADLSSALAIYEYMHPRMQDLDVEEAWILLMNQRYKLIKAMRISHGGISETAVDVRVIMREAVLSNATVLALCHNHPSNQAFPSTEDDRLTKRVQEASQLMRIYFLDHIIVTDRRYYSYREEGRVL
ncbi:DNA repair protein RadC [Hoylesella timonensis 4401737 = DSM 22865 = JCM 15640]|uniref:RadC family protein n=1 Tax=Hoylesella timonensis TaxID=386414 RepID=UPI0003FF8CC9|nr:DNA repair protein RadC [Hoylesella timonensis]